MTELKPCPFCGGKAVLHEAYKTERVECRAYIRCDNCGAHVGDDYPPTHLFEISDSTRNAIEKWSRRAERTCGWSHDDYHDESNNIWTTECGERFSWESFGHPKHCPNCGAKVVEP